MMNYDEAIKALDILYEKALNCDGEFALYITKAMSETEECKNTISKFIETAKKEHDLLDLYRLLIEFKERYNTDVRLLDKQNALDNIREITDEIYELERELE